MNLERLCTLFLILVVYENTVVSSTSTDKSNQPHSRKKRLVWITDDGRLALPPGTALTITPTISMPLVRYPPEGFFSNVSISFPVTVDFDKLGLTDNQNPFGDFPSLFARSMGRQAGDLLGNYVQKHLHFRRKRDLMDQSEPKTSNYQNFRIDKHPVDGQDLKYPELPEKYRNAFHGGERIMLYGVVEDFLGTFGMNGKACLLRTICEIHSKDINHLGVIGEMAKLFLGAKMSPFSDLIPDYVKAQEIGEGKMAPGECFPYYKECPKSIFKATQQNKYSENHHDEDLENDLVHEEVMANDILSM